MFIKCHLIQNRASKENPYYVAVKIVDKMELFILFSGSTTMCFYQWYSVFPKQRDWSKELGYTKTHVIWYDARVQENDFRSKINS